MNAKHPRGEPDAKTLSASSINPADNVTRDDATVCDFHEGAPAAPSTADEFRRVLEVSGLLTHEECDGFLKTLPAEEAAHDARSFAAALVEGGLITPYQSEVLQRGQSRGLVLGNYVVLEKLGEGGMGVVFKAHHRRMKRTVALKVLPPALTSSAQALARFHREVEAAAKLTHSNIAAAYDADEANGIHFLVMEFVDGPNLSACVKQAGPLPPVVAVQLTLQAARGLAHAHQQGVIHRDIKPGNLLVDRRGVLKILDMGLARMSESSDDFDGTTAELTQSGRVMGTVDYMAPEQALDAKRVDHRADIYSLGCTLYYLLMGRSISPETTLTKKLLWHQNQPAPRLTDVCEGVPAEVDAVFQQMVAKSAQDRQVSMDEVVEQLEACLADMPQQTLLLPEWDIQLHTSAPSTDRVPVAQAVTIAARPTRTNIETESASGEAESASGARRSFSPRRWAWPWWSSDSRRSGPRCFGGRAVRTKTTRPKTAPWPRIQTRRAPAIVKPTAEAARRPATEMTRRSAAAQRSIRQRSTSASRRRCRTKNF